VADNEPVLGIDFGTSNTVAVVRWPDGRVRPLLFDGAPLLPSAVYLDDSGALVAGREALHAARARPEAFEPNPKRRIDEGMVLLGEREVPVPDLIAAVLRRVAEEANRVLGGPPRVVLTHPAAWGARRCGLLLDAADRAGLTTPTLVEEPVAAGSYFVHVQGARVPVGSLAVIYDLGAGTFDASVLRRTDTGFDVLACEGLPDAGGLDIDAALIAYLGAVYAARHGPLWQRLERPATTPDRRARRLLWDDVRNAKESLSRTSATVILIPLLDEDAPLGREQLEHLARPILDRTVAATANSLREAGVRPEDVACLFLVGGGSRVPLAASLLHTAFRVAPTVIEQPEMVVAEGSLYAQPSTTPRDASPPAGFTIPAVIGRAALPTISVAAPPPPVAAAPPAHVSSPPYLPAPPPAQVSPPPFVAPPPPAQVPLPSTPVSVPPSPVPVPPAPVPTSSSQHVRGALLAGTALVVGLLVIVATEGAPDAFEIGLNTPFAYPALLLLLPAQVLLVASVAARGQLAAPGSAAGAFAAAVRFTALVIAGHAVGMGVGLARYSGGDWDADELLLAAFGGAGFIVGGIGLVIAALVDRQRRVIGPWHRYGVPGLLGLGSGLVVLATQPAASNEVFYTTFWSSSGPVADLSRYFAYTAAATLFVGIAALVSALVAAARPAPSPSVQRWLQVAAATAFVIAGITAIYAAAVLS
jgi:hypothetical protein